MSQVTNVTQTGSQLTTNYDLTKIFLGANRYKTGTFKNTGSSPVTLKAGTLLGKVTVIPNGDTANTLGYILPFKSNGVNGETIPVGILTEEYTVAAGATLKVNYCIAGDFDSGMLVLAKAEDTQDTIVNNEAIRELIITHTMLIGVTVSAMAAFDNQ